MKSAIKPCCVLSLLMTSLLLTACSGMPKTSGSGTGTPASATFTMGGTISGLSGTGLVLQDNGGDNLSISASGSFTFKTSLASGAKYAVTVLTQPTGPAQTCTVTNGSGTASANVTTVQVTCTTGTASVGGNAVGLSGTGLVLQNNGGDNLAVATSVPSHSRPPSPSVQPISLPFLPSRKIRRKLA